MVYLSKPLLWDNKLVHKSSTISSVNYFREASTNTKMGQEHGLLYPAEFLALSRGWGGLSFDDEGPPPNLKSMQREQLVRPAQSTHCRLWRVQTEMSHKYLEVINQAHRRLVCNLPLSSPYHVPEARFPCRFLRFLGVPW